MPDRTPDTRADVLDLEPKLKVKRLNRLAVLIAAILGIVVLWVGYFVLSSRPSIGRGDGQLPAGMTSGEEAAIDRLQREARAEPGIEIIEGGRHQLFHR